MKRYFFSYLRVTWLFGLVIWIPYSLIYLLVHRPTPDPIFAPIVSLMIWWTLISVAGAFVLAWFASHRKPLENLQLATGLFSRRYLDVNAPSNAVFDECLAALRNQARAKPIAQDRNRGILVGETKYSWTTWGCEINLRVEPLGEDATRVQVLSRPIVRINVIDFGTNRRNVDRLVDALKLRFPVLTEG
jgi:hypothetical protein